MCTSKNNMSKNKSKNKSKNMNNNNFYMCLSGRKRMVLA